MLGQMLEVVAKITINTALVSVLESAFIVLLTLCISNKDIIRQYSRERFKLNKRVILYPAMFMSITTNVLLYTGLRGVLNFVLLVLIYFMIADINIKYNINNYSKKRIYINTAIGLLLTMIVLVITDTISFLCINNVLGINLTEMNDNLLLNFISSSPGRLMQYIILFYVISKLGKDIDIFYGMLKEENNKIIVLWLILLITVILTIGYSVVFLEINVVILTMLIILLAILIFGGMFLVYLSEYKSKMDL